MPGLGKRPGKLMRVLDRLSRRSPALASFVSRTIDPLLNGAIILTALFIAVAFVRSSHPRFSAPTAPPKQGSDQVGRKISLQGVDWSKSEQTLLMFLSTQCGYCKKSEPFYRRLSSQITDHQKVRLIAVFPQSSDEVRAYLDHAQITVDDTRQSIAAANLNIKGTPTLMLVDKAGAATNEWIGLLSPADESDLLTRLHVR